MLQKIFSSLKFFEDTGKDQASSVESFLLLPGTKFDYISEAGVVYENSVVGACINFVYRKLLEAELTFFVKDTESGKWLKKSTLSTLEKTIIDDLTNPNEYYSMDAMFYGILVSFASNGKGYLYKYRNKLGRVTGYIYIHHTMLKQIRNNDNLIEYYEFTNNSGKKSRIDAKDIIQFTYGVSPSDPSFGYPIFRPALRDIAIDNTAASLEGALFRNKGVPGALAIPKVSNGKPPTKEQRHKLSELWKMFRGDKAGSLLPLPIPMDIKEIGFTNEQMQLGSIRNEAASRIASLYGLDIMVLGLPSDNKTYSNFGEALDAAIEHCVIPQLSLISTYLNRDLSREFALDISKVRLGFDLSNVRGLQEDLDKYHTRIRQDWKSGLISHEVASKLLNYPPVPEYAGKTIFDIMGSINGLEEDKEKSE